MITGYHYGQALTPPLSCRERDTIDRAQHSGRKQTGVPVQTRLMQGSVGSGHADFVTEPLHIHVHEH